MKKRKLWVSIMAGLLAALMIFGIVASALPAYVGAEKSSDEIEQEIEDWKEKKEEIEKQIEELEQQISDNMDEMEEIVAQKNIIDQQVFLLYQQIQTINQEIASYSELIANKQDDLDKATARYEELKAKHKERIRAMEEDGTLSYWSVLFKANSFSDFLDRLNMIEEIAASDQRRLEELNKATLEVEAAKAGLETEKVALELSKKELNKTSEQLSQSRAEAEKLLNRLVATGEEFERLLHDAEEKQSEAEATIDDLEWAYDEAKDREYQEWLDSLPKPPPQGGNAGAPNVVDGVTWLIPVDYDDFSSPFGYRIHPIYGDWRMHYGVDLGAEEGKPIVATRSGIVTTTDYEDDGAGFYVNINHLDGFASRYMHMTHYIVSPGESVAAGQVIGYVGSTGASTGPHLHFGIYYNGVAVNPALYINL